MENGKVVKAVSCMFTEEELSGLGGLKIFEDHIEVTCGCTSSKYGDAVGRLRVYQSGELLINCECLPGCEEDNLTPAAFETHSQREGAKKWKNYVWVFVDGEKVPLFKTPLLRYYEKSLDGKWSHRHVQVHRDEFVQCTRCKKMRRFRLKNEEECRSHHDAVLKSNWICADYPHEEISCAADEERSTRVKLRGCPHKPLCDGCTLCVCFGCYMCCYPDCNCQACIDFTQNAQKSEN